MFVCNEGNEIQQKKKENENEKNRQFQTFNNLKTQTGHIRIDSNDYYSGNEMQKAAGKRRKLIGWSNDERRKHAQIEYLKKMYVCFVLFRFEFY